jgi:hypothetical protein
MKKPAFATITLLWAMMATMASAQSNDGARLEGTWRSTGTFNSGFTLKSLFTFGAGKNATSGIVIETWNTQLTASPSCGAAQGVWKRIGERRFIVTLEAFCFDTFKDFAPAGYVNGKADLTLNESGTEFSGQAHIEIFDVNGTLVFADNGTDVAVRMSAEAPPL